MADEFRVQRQNLVTWLRMQGIHDKRVLAAIEHTPREHFLEEAQRSVAYADRALPLCLGQTISQPLMVAIMSQALQLTGQERVLEIGTGSGYQTAILAQLGTYIYSIERYQQLAERAALKLAQLEIQNISISVGDGSLGWSNEAPYQRILVTAAAPEVPAHLFDQLELDGLLVIPVGKPNQQELEVIRRMPWGMQVQSLGRCAFVPLVGAEGWHE